MKIEEQIRLLGIFHYVVAGFHFLFGCFGLLYVGMGGLFAYLAASPKMTSQGEPPPLFMGLFFVLFGLAFMLIPWTMAVFSIISGRYLAKRKKRTFSIVVGAMNCAFLPFGTVLGIFDIVVLTSEDARRLYGEAPPPATPPPLT